MEGSQVGLKEPQKNISWGFTLAIIMIGAFMAILDSSIVNVAIPSMMHDFQATTDQIEWVSTIYMLTLGVVVPLCGWLGDFLGAQRLYTYSLMVFTLGSALCAFAWSENVLIAARVVQALGGGMIMPTTMTMVYSIVPREKIGSAMGTFGLSMLVAPAIGPTLGGYLVQYVSWRWIFTINLPIGIVGSLLALFLLPEFPRKPAGKFDVLGSLTSAAGLFSLLLGLSEGESWGWSSLSIVLLIYFGIAILGIFVYHELTTEDPLLDLRIFKYPIFTLGNVMLIVITIGMYGGLFYIPYFLQAVRGLGALKAGTLMLPPALVSAAVLPFAGRIYDKFGPKIPVAVGTLIMALGTFLFTKVDINTPLSTIVFWNMFRSAGMGLMMMPLQTAIMAEVPQELVGRGSAITNIIRQVAGSFGLALLTLLLDRRITYHSTYMNWTTSLDHLNQLASTNGIDPSIAQTLLLGNLSQYSFVQSLNDMFLVTSLISLLIFIPSFLLKKGKAPSPKGAVTAE